MTPAAPGHPEAAFGVHARVYACGASGVIRGIQNRREPPRLRYWIETDQGDDVVVDEGEVAPC